MSGGDQEHRLEDLRRLLHANFDVPGLIALYQDVFPELAESLGTARGLQKIEIVNAILDHTRRQDTATALRQAIDTRMEQEQVPTCTSAAAPIITIPFNLPPGLPDFTGRDDQIAEIRQHLERIGTVAISGIHGMGGIGKTALALHIAHGLAAEGRFCDVQLYLDLKGTDPVPLAAEAALGTLLSALQGPDPRRPEDVKVLAQMWRAALHGKDALLVLDNAAGANQVRPLLPGGSTCTVLVTSRRRFALPGAGRLDLTRMAPTEAQAFLQGLAPHLTDGEANQIADLCGALPLALRVAGNYLGLNNDCPPEEYVRRLVGERERLRRLRDPDDPDLDVAAAIGLSVQQLDQEERHAWALLALLPTPFDELAAGALWEQESQVQGSELPKATAGELPTYLAGMTLMTSQSDEAIQALLQTLRNRSLLSYDPETGRYEQHDLLWLAAARDLENQPEEKVLAARTRLAQHYVAVASAAVDAQNYLALDTDWPHLQAALEHATQRQDNTGRRLVLALLWPVAAYLDPRGLTSQRIKWLAQAVFCAQELGDLRSESAFSGMLGQAHAALGQTNQALEYYEQALTIARKANDRRGEGEHLGNLGNAHVDLGQMQQAIEYYHQALDIHRETDNRRGEGNVLGSLGIASYRLGQLQEAIDYHQSALAIHKEIGDRLGEGTDLSNLATAHTDRGAVKEALDAFEQALGIQQEIGNRRGEGVVLGNLGRAHANLGKIEQAIEYYEQALAIASEVGDRRGEGNRLGNLGNAYASLGGIARSVEYYEQALTIHREIANKHGEEIALGAIAVAHERQGEIEPAIRAYRQAIDLACEIGDRNNETLHSWNLGRLYADSDPAQALELMAPRVTFEQEIDHPMAEADARRVDQIRSRLA